MKCELCGRNRPENNGVVVTLTDADREIFLQLKTPVVADTVFYCKPCHSVLSDPEDGAKVLSGLMETKLRVAGMAPAQAEMLGNNMRRLLMEKASAKKDT